MNWRFEIRSARHLAELAAAPLPAALEASPPRRSQHRDVYLDTLDDSLRKRGIVCRLRIRADDTRTLSLSIEGDDKSQPVLVDSDVQSPNVPQALAEQTAAGRRLSALLDPATLQVRLEVEVERTTRHAGMDWLRRPRAEIHYDSMVARRNGISAHLYQLCVHYRHGSELVVADLVRAMEATHHLRPTREGSRDRAELLLRW